MSKCYADEIRLRIHFRKKSYEIFKRSRLLINTLFRIFSMVSESRKTSISLYNRLLSSSSFIPSSIDFGTEKLDQFKENSSSQRHFITKDFII